MKTTQYKVVVYTGLAWLKEVGTFDLWDEAQDALMSEHDKYCSNCEDEETRQHASEAFMFDSRIEPIYV